MFLVALRDLQFRRRRFLISVLAVALVFGLSLLYTGLALSFDLEIDRTLAQIGADGYVVPDAATGPFFNVVPLPESKVSDVKAAPGVTAAAPILMRPLTAETPKHQGLNVFGIVAGQIGSPPLVAGRLPAAENDAVIDDQLDWTMGTQFLVSGRTFSVVGITHNSTLLAGRPNVFVPLRSLQGIAVAGQPIVTAIAVAGVPTQLPAGFKFIDRQVAHADLLDPVAAARSSIVFTLVLLWLVAGAILMSVVFLSANERIPEFAVFKALGVPSRSVISGLILQSTLTASVSVVFAVVIGFALAPFFPVRVQIPLEAVILVVVIGLVIGGVTSLAAVRRALRVDPAAAFG